MAITHFKINSYTNSNTVNLKIDGVNLVLGQLYPISLENTLQAIKTDPLVITSLASYISVDSLNNIESPESFISFKWSFDENVLPEQNGGGDVVLENDILLNLYDHILPNEGSEYLIVKSTSGVSNINIDGGSVELNEKIPIADVKKITAKTPLDSGSLNYLTITYQLGQDIKRGTVVTENKSPEYTSVFSIDSLAEIQLINETKQEGTIDVDVNGTIESRKTFSERYIFSVSKSDINSIANIKVESNCAFLNNTNNKIVVTSNPVVDFNSGTQEHTFQYGGYKNDFNESKNIQLDSVGSCDINVLVFIEDDGTPQLYSGTIDLTILDVNGETSRVSTLNNTIQLPINIQS